MQPYELTISQALRAMEKKQLSAVELTESCLQRIEQIDDQVQAFITVSGETAMQQAKAADESRATNSGGALCGIPLSVKDLLSVQGLPMTCGSKILQGYTPPYDATVVSSIKEAGAVILGKVSMDEFAMGSTSETCAYGVPGNPWRLDHVAGGSSGGSAASVAAGQCLASLGSDTGGSIRQPASLCGIVGLKPTYGRVSRYGLTAFASSLDQVGPLARTVEDAALLMEVIAGHDERDSTSVNKEVPRYRQALKEGLAGLKVGVPREYYSQGIDPQVEKTVRQGIEVLRSRGAEVVEVSLPHTSYCVAVYYLIAPSEASSNLARYDGVHYGYRAEGCGDLLDVYTKSRSQGFGAEVKRRILIGTYALSSGYYDAYYKKASQVRSLIIGDFKKAFASCDVLISPVTPTAAWPKGQSSDDPLALYMSDILTISANLAGIPGMSVPGGFTTDGLPIGIQLQADHFCEETLVQVGYNLEQELGFGNRLPSL